MKNVFAVSLLFIGLGLWPCKGGAQFLNSYAEHLRRNLPSVGLMFAGGAFNGVSDVLRNHYSTSVFPKSGPAHDFWNPEVSWERKYRDWPTDKRAAYPGAKTWLVWTTDGWHLSKTMQLTSMQGAVLLYDRPLSKKFLHYVADLIIFKLVFSVGWHIAAGALR